VRIREKKSAKKKQMQEKLDDFIEPETIELENGKTI
jgi:hypothetical protein